MPHNLSLIVSGKFKDGTESLLSAVQNEVEPSLIQKGWNKGARPTGWVRPILETPSALRDPWKGGSDIVEFPGKDESVGDLLLQFIGPAPNDFLGRKVRPSCQSLQPLSNVSWSFSVGTSNSRNLLDGFSCRPFEQRVRGNRKSSLVRCRVILVRKLGSYVLVFSLKLLLLFCRASTPKIS